MANEKKLDCVILGLLSHEDLTGYQIKKRLDTALRFFWHASYGSIYPTLGALVQKGLAEKSAGKENGREKIIYTITEAGREHLKNWLSLPAIKDELRYETLLKLFFCDEAGPELAIKHIENFESKTRKELAYLSSLVDDLENVADQDNAHLYYHLTAMLGIKVFTVYLDWCQEAKALLECSAEL